MQPLPQEFLSWMQALLRDEYEAFHASLNTPPEKGIRCNPLKIKPDRFQKLFPGTLSALPWCPTGFTFNSPHNFQAGRHPYQAAGLYYLQDPAAMAAAELLKPQPGERILDLAAAPGGKATHLAALMNNQGLLMANDIHPGRVWDLAGNLERWGTTCSIITNETPARLAARLPGFFDRVLVDAPCSGEALFRRSDEARRAWSPQAVQQCAFRQQGILEQAAELVRSGGRMLYATCTFNPQEDEKVIFDFLEQHPDFSLVQTEIVAGAAKGRSEWVSGAEHANGSGMFRLWPHLSPGDGHFLALLQRNSGDIEETGQPKARNKPARLPAEATLFFNEFVQVALDRFMLTSELRLAGSYLYEAGDQVDNLAGLKLTHPGRWLGVLKKNRFEPSHALALSLKIHQAQNVCNLEVSDPNLACYLAGEHFKHSGEPGWVLVSVEGYPLGWGKRVNSIIKSHYPRGLRWL